ncbi:PGM3 [Bugula neritina]|uniref:Phosphoacetylglucosamine mutase n=1 Tax=Bugula neritina TaxID=10212 RepID=A0A7J7KQM3_BUGNE|nr:PGM3 [Bugula neritina]
MLHDTPVAGIMSSFADVIKHAAQNYPKTDQDAYLYGTAGFRMKAEKLNFIAYRVGILASLRSQAKSAVTGVMITASHNPACDNGVKIIEPHGEMLHVDWESFATKMVNCRDEDLGNVIQSIIEETKLDPSITPQVFVGMDTRPSSPGLSKACQAGVSVMNGKVTDYGYVTTPQLHYIVWSHNTKFTHPPTQEGYYLKISTALRQFLDLCKHSNSITQKVTVDGSNGVGAMKVKELQAYLGDMLTVNPVFDGSTGVLNYQCGADYVKSNQTSPVGLDLVPGEKYASFDGDADRIVYYFITQDGKFQLLDGDKIAILIASYLKQLLVDSGLSKEISLGLVQTAYANGASTEYISDKLSVPVSCSKTGVKHLHHCALQYDIGVYFEANGHGTVMFSDKAAMTIDLAAKSADANTAAGTASLKLSALTQLIMQIVGDAISDLVFVEAILTDLKMTLSQWNDQYTDLPNVLCKVSVADRQVIKTTNAERTATSPIGLQAAIDEAVLKVSKGRSFVRPSGTEDVVRVYAEASTLEEVKQLSLGVACLVYDMCGGVGERPV